VASVAGRGKGVKMTTQKGGFRGGGFGTKDKKSNTWNHSAVYTSGHVGGGKLTFALGTRDAGWGEQSSGVKGWGCRKRVKTNEGGLKTAKGKCWQEEEHRGLITLGNSRVGGGRGKGGKSTPRNLKWVHFHRAAKRKSERPCTGELGEKEGRGDEEKTMWATRPREKTEGVCAHSMGRLIQGFKPVPRRRKEKEFESLGC